MRQNGLKITPQRQEIVKVLLKSGHKCAEDIHRQVICKFPNVSLDTVYRNLNKLKELGIIDTVNFADGRQRYEFCDSGSHHHHLVCLGCGKHEELNFCPLDFLDCSKIKDKNFKIKEHKFEVFGYCSDCATN
jgi:Fur family zinc uptake transcriptional regulator/Fur family ferric uptake transcriptional regulator